MISFSLETSRAKVGNTVIQFTEHEFLYWMMYVDVYSSEKHALGMARAIKGDAQ